MTVAQLTTWTRSRVPTGRQVRVAAFEGGCEFRHRLASMGVNVGCSMRILRGSGGGLGGPVLVALGHSRLAIGRGMAERILVCLLSP